jgi:hypothetical protein
VILQPVSGSDGTRLFFLNKGQQEKYYFLEEVDAKGSWIMVASYAKQAPLLRDVVKRVVEYLSKKRAHP